MSSNVRFAERGLETLQDRVHLCRQMVVGPWHNQPQEYPGYNGFVGWAGLTRLRSGRRLIAFSSGYWHASFPQTPEVKNDPACREIIEEFSKMGLPDIHAPRGGRAELTISDDDGITWSKPQPLIDTPLDDRHPTIVELDDGTWLCTFFVYRLPKYACGAWMRSCDAGTTWSEIKYLPVHSGFGNGPAIQLKDGTVVWIVGGRYPEAEHHIIGVYRSADGGNTFQLASTINAGHGMAEPSVAELPDGRLIAVCRQKDDICWSSDGGRTWSKPVSIGVELYDPHVLLMPNGVLACFHGSYQKGGLRVILSPDGGQTWHGPGNSYGYAVDTGVYGYSHPILLPDGSAYLVYLQFGGHHSANARTEALWTLRVKVNDAADGIEILPAPGSPAATGAAPVGYHAARPGRGDPELGKRF